MKNLFVLVFFLLIPQVIGGLVSVITQPSITGWYQQLNRPWFTPPDWLFGPVWILLYITIGISGYLVWKEIGWKWSVLKWFFIQAFLNGLWSILFFGLQQPFLAFIEIALLELAILIMFTKFKRISKQAGYILIPYLAWVGFASLLNLAIVILN